MERKWGTVGRGLGSDGFGRWSIRVDRGGATWVVAKDGGSKFQVSRAAMKNKIAEERSEGR